MRVETRGLLEKSSAQKGMITGREEEDKEEEESGRGRKMCGSCHILRGTDNVEAFKASCFRHFILKY